MNLTRAYRVIVSEQRPKMAQNDCLVRFKYIVIDSARFDCVDLKGIENASCFVDFSAELDCGG